MRRETLSLIRESQRHKQPLVLVTAVDSGRQSLIWADDRSHGEPLPAVILEHSRRALAEDRSQLLEDDDRSWFLQVIGQPWRMVIIGAVHISQALVPMAVACGYEVTIIDPRQAFATTARFPAVRLLTEWPHQALASLAPDRRTAIVVLTHDPKLDDPALVFALRSEAFYIGALGSNKTQFKRRARLREQGFSDAQQNRIQGPVGLDIGARSPAEIAVAILAAVTRQRRSPVANQPAS